MYLDPIEGEPSSAVAWGSDIPARMLRELEVPFVSLNPGASFRGLHDSIVNHLGNRQPGIILCMHEDHAVAVAHGFAKVTNEPMACALHSNVGLMHGMMSMFNAYCDRVPMLVLGATGPVDSEQRRPWIDWLHTSKDQGSLVRSFVKWDDEPRSPGALIQSILRANAMTRSAPTAPVYVCLDAGLQEAPLDEEPKWPRRSRYEPPAPPRPARVPVERAVDLLCNAERPLILFGRARRRDRGWAARLELAERLGACVMTDLKTASMFPTDHPQHVVEPFNKIGRAAQAILREADVILSLDWIDLGGALRQAGAQGEVKATIIHASLDATLHNGANMDYFELPAVDVAIAAGGDEVVEDLIDLLPAERGKPWREAERRPAPDADPQSISLAAVALSLRAAFEDPDAVTLIQLPRGWPTALWPLRHPLAYLGKDGGGGIGGGPGISVGAALALQGAGRPAVTILGDGDFAMGASALWTAVRHRIPLLVLLNNNRSYYNDELHQESVAHKRGRNPANRWIGQRLGDPDPDFAKLAESYGAVGIGPVRDPGALDEAIRRGVAELAKGGVCLIDIHVDPGEERRTAAAVDQRGSADAKAAS